MMESEVVQETEVAPEENIPVLSELREPVWSLVSFEECIKSGLTYDEAVEKMDKLIAEKVSGLCIITDEAASKI